MTSGIQNPFFTEINALTQTLRHKSKIITKLIWLDAVEWLEYHPLDIRKYLELYPIYKKRAHDDRLWWKYWILIEMQFWDSDLCSKDKKHEAYVIPLFNLLLWVFNLPLNESIGSMDNIDSNNRFLESRIR